ncbi:MAG: hypothetical protein AB1758_29165, partial [Candidatus Eremiobacterota bacterium]
MASASVNPAVTAPIATPTPTPAAKPTPAPVPTPGSSAPADSATVSSTPTNPYQGISDNFSNVKVDKWKQGKNDCIEHILQGQGYTLEEIYKKDSDGKTLVQRVAEKNDLKDPNLLQPGKELVVPSKKDAQAASTRDLEKGESKEISAGNENASVTAEVSKTEDGKGQAKVSTDNRESDARLSTESQVGEKGRIDAVVSSQGDTAKAQTVAKSGDGTAITKTDVTATPDQSQVRIKDIDRQPGNMQVEVGQDAVTTTNPAKTKGDDVTTRTDISESSSDGPIENAGRWVAGLFGYGDEKKDPVTV